MYVRKPTTSVNSTDQSDADRRAIKRRHLIYYLRVWDADYEQLLGHVVDISTEGFMLISDHDIPRERRYNLVIRLPDEGGETRELRFEAIVRWSRNDINKDFFDTGFQFVDKAPEAIEQVQELIELYGFHD